MLRFPLIYLLTFGGISLFVQHRDRRDVWLLGIVFTAMTVLGLVFYVDYRLRMPLEVLILIVASFGWYNHRFVFFRHPYKPGSNRG